MAYYRIVTDEFAGYEVQSWRWWWPFWVQGTINTHSSIAEAEEYAEEYAKGRAKRVVKNIGRLP